MHSRRLMGRSPGLRTIHPTTSSCCASKQEVVTDFRYGSTASFELGPATSHVPPETVDGSVLARTFFTSQAWSVLPCVRPLDAVHMTAGHNTLRGSGPGQQHAFDDAMAQVGCPDRRIDRLCITCCSPSNLTSRRMPGAISFTAQVRRDSYIVHPWPSWPRPSEQSCWQARWRRPSSGADLTKR